MDLEQIEQHWKNWAETFGTDIRATEKSKTRKFLEIDALVRAIHFCGYKKYDNFSILEPGCGTGHNCLAIAEHFPNASIYGFDYIPEMVDNAKLLQQGAQVSNIDFFVGDLLNIHSIPTLNQTFDVVFTNRCIINLNTPDLQEKVIGELSQLLNANGALLIAENPEHKFSDQNMLRSFLGLPNRNPPDFNLLLDEKIIQSVTQKNKLKLIYEDNFSALHDLLLYVLLPKINDGELDYDHPILEAASSLSPKVFAKVRNAFGDFGQNKLYLLKKYE